MSNINLTDDELEGLMAELEEQNALIAAAAATASPKPEADPVPAAAPVEEAAEPSAVSAEVLAASAGEADEGGDSDEAEELAALAAELEEREPEVEPAAVSGVAEKPVGMSPEADAPIAVAPTAPSAIPDAPSERPERAEPRRPSTEESATPGLQHYVDVDQFRADTRVTEATLDACMIEQNGLRSYYGAQAARAEAQHARLKVKFEVIEATLYDKHRKDLAASGEKVTEKMVENAVKMDPRWLKAKNLVIEAETIASINKSLVESLKDRRDMIIQLGADRRDEYKGQARILAEQQERDQLRDRARAAVQGRVA